MNPAPPLLGKALADDLANARAAAGEKPTADDTLLRGSDAYNCGRKIAFAALKVPRVVPYSPSTLAAFDTGEHVHTRLQAILVRDFGADVEVPVSYKDDGIDLSGHADAVYTTGADKRVAEIKTMKSFPFLKAAGGNDRFGRAVEPEGPKLEHVLQAGIYAHAPQVRADTLHMIYINKEDSAVAEWLIPLKGQPFGPHGEDVFTLVMAELGRLKSIEDDIRRGLLPWRRIPGHGVVKNPPGADSKDEPWQCRYCAWQPLCASLPPSPIAVGLATQTGDEILEAF